MTYFPTSGPGNLPPTDLASIRARLEALQAAVYQLQQNRFTVGPDSQRNQQQVPLHGLANAQAMATVQHGQTPVFDATSGQLYPGGPVFYTGGTIVGPMPGARYSMMVNHGSAVVTASGGNATVLFDQPFENAVFSVVACVGDYAGALVTCSITDSGVALSGFEAVLYEILSIPVIESITLGPAVSSGGYSVDSYTYGSVLGLNAYSGSVRINYVAFGY